MRGGNDMTGKATSAAKPKKVSKFSKRKVDPAFYWMTVPAAILVAAFLYWPFLQGAAYSFTNSQGYGDFKFIGFKNYIAMFQDARVGHAYVFTIFIAILITLGTNLIGMFLAVLLNSKIAFQERVPRDLLHPVHPVRAGHRLCVQVHLHDAVARARSGVAYRLAVHVDDLRSESRLVPDCVPVHLAGRGVLHAAVSGRPADHR